MNSESPKRAYRQSARALAAEGTATRILDAFESGITARWSCYSNGAGRTYVAVNLPLIPHSA